MTNTRTASAPSFDSQVLAYLQARHTFNHSRLGSARGDAAERRMERLVAWAENNDVLAEFCSAVWQGILEQQGAA